VIAAPSSFLFDIYVLNRQDSISASHCYQVFFQALQELSTSGSHMFSEALPIL